MTTNASHAVTDGDAGQPGAALKRITANTGHALRDGDAGQPGAALKLRPANTGHAVTDGDAGQPGAIIERITANTGHAVRDGDAGQPGAAGERITANAGHAVRDGDAGQPGANPERIIANAGNGIAPDGIRNHKLTGGGGTAISDGHLTVGDAIGQRPIGCRLRFYGQQEQTAHQQHHAQNHGTKLFHGYSSSAFFLSPSVKNQ